MRESFQTIKSFRRTPHSLEESCDRGPIASIRASEALLGTWLRTWLSRRSRRLTARALEAPDEGASAPCFRGTDGAELIRAADSAMYEARRNGRSYEAPTPFARRPGLRPVKPWRHGGATLPLGSAIRQSAKMTQHEQWEFLRRSMEDRLHELQAQVGDDVALAVERHERRRGEVLDAGERSEDDEAAFNRDALRERRAEEILALQAALHRFEQDTYGRCIDCQDEIDEARLRAQPEAPRCLACERRHEARRRPGALRPPR